MNSPMPRVSVGMPVYNGERFLEEAVSALLNQRFDDFELVIADNASTDRTEEICRAYVAQDKRVAYHRHSRNLGLARNYRRVFDLSNGTYFKWATYDDVCAPEFIGRCVDALDQDERVVLAYPKGKIIDEWSEIKAECTEGLHLQSPKASERMRQLLRNLKLSNALYGVMRKSVLSETRVMGDYPGADICLLGELALRGLFYEVPEFLFFRRLHPGATSQTPDNRSQMAAYNPDKVGRLVFREWRLLYEHCLSVKGGPLPLAEKMRVWCFLLKSATWNRDQLIRELLIGFKHWTGVSRH